MSPVPFSRKNTRPMRIQVLSDLHLEFGHGIPPLAPGAEIVVLAGDLAPAKRRSIRLAAEAWAGADRILYVPGNHEYYGDAIGRAQRTLALDCGLYGVTLLDTAAVTIGHVRFIGATLWTDFRLDGEPRELDAHLAVGRGLNDFAGAIRGAVEPGRAFSTWEAAHRHRRDRAFIEAEIALAHEAGLEAVVVTHHAPSPVAIHHRYAGSPLNAGFVSDLEATIVHLRPTLWIHGHVHHAVNATVGRTWILANPHGNNFMEAADFQPDLVVEL